MKIIKLIFITNLILLALLSSCKKEDELKSNNFIINGETIEIDKAIISMHEGQIEQGFKNYRIAFYSKGVHFYKNKDGYDSLTYDNNSVMLYFWVVKPEFTNKLSGEFYFSPDSSYNFSNSGFLDCRNGSYIHYIANSGQIFVNEKNMVFNINFRFERKADSYWPNNFDIKGNYNGKIQINYD